MDLLTCAVLICGTTKDSTMRSSDSSLVSDDEVVSVVGALCMFSSEALFVWSLMSAQFSVNNK